ncbi:MAG: 2-oxoacid:acceptor oxidoreductase subunit alpha [Candidatus Thermoplasmatota archaeon]|jgi:2-oxoglutarate ferredoxin oxidoreductase subunit alpha|nr:2-oxoacid:acceptor oxidoreductase subunit alpha [Candidatus Thermoplasmatota archaeon]MCL5984133.1 2-oxoacid:acceptor oxidoreductase subunit alpha [Candidatus Thermoplasmatota archaeon]
MSVESTSNPRTPQVLKDISVLTGGQGGDGTLTVSDLLARYFHSQGLYVYNSRAVLSRIRGGYAAASSRGCTSPILAQKAEQDVIVAFHQDAVTFGAKSLSADGFILGDDKVVTTPDAKNLILLPLSITAASKIGQPLYKNVVAFGALSVLMGMDRTAARGVVERRFGRRGEEARTKNLNAFDLGVELAEQNVGHTARFSLEHGTASNQVLITGNQAAAYGFVVGGGRFFAGYPITPATSIMETLMKILPPYKGVVRQAEDELSAINMTLGGAYAGARAMTATSGPGFSLMTEALGHAGEAEIPVVIADCQRVGPSTGEPTRNEQSDLLHSVFASHGEFPRFVIAPGFPQDAFDLMIASLNLAERWQLPIIFLLDQALGENLQSAPRMTLEHATVDRGKLLTEEALNAMTAYKRYEFTKDGISPRTIPGMKGGQSQVTGNEHDEWGHVSVNVENRKQMMAKRMTRLRLAKSELPQPLLWGDEKARVGFIGFGCTFGPIREAQQMLKAKGITSRFYQARTLWPVPVETLAPFLSSVDVVFVVEHNYMGQFAMLIREYVSSPNIESIVKYDGSSFVGQEIAYHVEQTMKAHTSYGPGKTPIVLHESEGGGF